MKHTRRMLTNNPTYYNPSYITPRGIVVHSTGCNQRKIEPYYNGFNQADTNKSVHGFIGIDNEGELCYTQTLPYNHKCWGCGKGSKGSYNNGYIQFEICEDVTNAEWTKATYEAALELCVELCEQYNIDPANVVCHSEAHALGYASNHADVMHWWSKYGYSMYGFRQELKERLDDMVNDTYIEKFNDLPDWAKPDMRKLLDEQIINGGTDYATDPDDINMKLSDIKTVLICKRMIEKAK